MGMGLHDAAVLTVGDLLAKAERALAAAGVPEPRREAADLYAAVICGATSAAWLERGSEPPDAVRARFADVVARRVEGWPQAYAAGRANFRGHWLLVDRRVLIPRPETEGLVERVIRVMRESGTGNRESLPVVIDVGTGSGAIAIALALEAPVAGVIATDVSAAALAVAIENATLLGASERISFRRGHLLEPLLGERVDAVVSNPPYVATGEWDQLDRAVREFEPRLALDGGPDGLREVRALLGAARAALTAGGLLALEVDARRAEESAALAAAAGFAGVEVGEDLFGRPRYVLGRQPGAGDDR